MHLKVHGPLEPMGGEQLAGLAEAIGLKGRGGAGFPFAKKLRSVAESAISKGIRPVVVVNGSEDEPACRKDTVLINRAPHLILDGALLAAEAMGARTLVIGVTRESTQRSMEAALAERGLSDRRGSPLRARVQRNPVRMVTERPLRSSAPSTAARPSRRVARSARRRAASAARPPCCRTPRRTRSWPSPPVSASTATATPVCTTSPAPSCSPSPGRSPAPW